jgi:hypothetical protein
MKLEIPVDVKNQIHWISNFDSLNWKCGVVGTPIGMGSSLGRSIGNSIDNSMGQF